MSTLDLNEAAALLKIHPATLQQKARAGQIPGAKIGRAWVFVEVDLLEYVRSQYQRQALQVTHRKEVEPCHFADVARSGGSISSPQAENEYADLLGLRTKP
jgi:excisionase family DNA binding protein